jgi:hypothetical protein
MAFTSEDPAGPFYQSQLRRLEGSGSIYSTRRCNCGKVVLYSDGSAPTGHDKIKCAPVEAKP